MLTSRVISFSKTGNGKEQSRKPSSTPVYVGPFFVPSMLLCLFQPKCQAQWYTTNMDSEIRPSERCVFNCNTILQRRISSYCHNKIAAVPKNTQ